MSFSLLLLSDVNVQVLLRGWSTGLQQPTNRESVVQAYATVRMPSQNEAQMITQQIEASLPERAKVRSIMDLSRDSDPKPVANPLP